MSQASGLKSKPTKEVHDAMASVTKLSSSSDSLVRVDLSQKDGSVLVITSFQGADAKLDVIENVDAPDPVSVPRLDDSPPPQGVGDDGVNRDESGQPVDLKEGEK